MTDAKGIAALEALEALDRISRARQMENNPVFAMLTSTSYWLAPKSAVSGFCVFAVMADV